MTTSTQPASPRQVLLGLFILGQLTFLLLSNTVGFVKWYPSQLSGESARLVNQLAPHFADEQGHGYQWCEELDRTIRRWPQLTGQDQDWALFAPNIATATSFPALILRHQVPADDPLPTQAFHAQIGHHWLVTWQTITWLRSENEPADIDSYYRIGQCRLRRYEGMLAVDPLPRAKETPGHTAARVTQNMRKQVLSYRPAYLAYLKWRLKAWQETQQGNALPSEVILVQRFYRIHGPAEAPGWDGPLIIPTARWRPIAGQADGDVVLDVYDFSQKRFIDLNG